MKIIIELLLEILMIICMFILIIKAVGWLIENVENFVKIIGA